MYTIKICQGEPWLVSGAYTKKVIGYDAVNDAFIREKDSKVSARLVPKDQLLSLLGA